MNEIVQSKIDTLLNGYISDPNRIEQDYVREIREIKAYRGREMLELIQNAVDEIPDGQIANNKEKRVCIEYTGTTVTVSNNGNIFSEGGITSLMYSDKSPKSEKEGFIGNKGTGFRSILNWAEEVSIFSGDLSILFSNEHANEVLSRLKANQKIQSFIEKNGGQKIATLVTPKIINKHTGLNYDTTIQIRIKNTDTIKQSIESQLSELDDKTILFLPRLEKMIIKTVDKEMVYEKKIISKNKLDSDYYISELNITKSIDGIAGEPLAWNIIERFGKYSPDANEEIKNHISAYNVAVAYRPDSLIETDFLYSFFKTKIPFPLPILAHGTFELGENRNHLVLESGKNDFVLKQLCQCIIESAKYLSKKGIDYSALEILANQRDFPQDLLDYQFESLLSAEMLSRKILPTVNDDYIAFSDMPKFYESNLASFLKSDDFACLLKYTDNKKIVSFIKRIANKNNIELKYSYDEIVKNTNTIVGDFSIDDRASCAVAFKSEYQIQPTNYPHFIIDMNKNTSDESRFVYLQPDSGNADFTQPPAFSQIAYMNDEMQAVFLKILGINSREDLAKELKDYNVREYAITPILASIRSKLYEIEKQENILYLNQCIAEAVHWFLKNKGNIPEKTTDSILLLAKDGKLHETAKLYWNAEYGNKLCEQLLPNRNDLFVYGSDVYNLQPNEIDDFIDFFTKLGVAKYPRISSRSISIDENYQEYVKTSFKFPLKAGDNYYSGMKDLKKQGAWISSTATLNIVEHLDSILENVPTKAILDWLREDEYIYRYAISSKEASGSYLSVLQGNEYSEWKYRVNSTDIACYIHYVFLTSKWIEIDGSRYSPSQCIFYEKVSTRLLPEVIALNPENYVHSTKQKNNEVSDLKELFAKLGVVKTFAELPTPIFYKILLKLPEVDSNGELSKKLYQSLIDNQGLNDTLYKEDSDYTKFISDGLVFCKSNRKFCKIFDSHYASAVLPDSLMREKNIIDISHRQSATTIENYLGIKTFKIEMKLSGEPVIHSLNNVFSQDFTDFRTLAFCYRLTNAHDTEISRFKELQIKLCSELNVEYDGKMKSISNFEYFYEKPANIGYIKVAKEIDVFEKLKSDLKFCADVSYVVMELFNIQDDDLFSRLRALYGLSVENRNEIIKQDFDSADIIAEAKEKLDIAYSQKGQLNDILKSITKAELDIAMLSILERLDITNWTDVKNAELQMELLKLICTDVEEFNSQSMFPINFKPYYRMRLHTLQEERKTNYKNNLFESLKSSNIETQRYFCRKWHSYENDELLETEIENLLEWDYEQFFSQKYPESALQSSVSADENYKNNMEIFSREKDADIVNDFFTNLEYDSLLYFGNLGYLNSEYTTHKMQYEKDIEVESNLTLKDTIFELYVTNASTKSVHLENNLTLTKNTYGGTSVSLGLKRQRNNENWGRVTERAVYHYLRKIYNNDVIWVSENAKKDNINPSGRAGCGYDIEYTDENNVKKYVEVKSTKGNACSFYISEHELNFAENHANDYELYLITDVEDTRKCFCFKELFIYPDGVDRNTSKRFSLCSEKNYTIQLEPIFDSP